MHNGAATIPNVNNVVTRFIIIILLSSYDSILLIMWNAKTASLERPADTLPPVLLVNVPEERTVSFLGHRSEPVPPLNVLVDGVDLSPNTRPGVYDSNPVLGQVQPSASKPDSELLALPIKPITKHTPFHHISFHQNGRSFI